jgi:hypothetical protein
MAENEPKLVGGRPPKYNTAKELQAAIEDYFANGVTERTIIVGPSINRRTETIPVPTITGLVLHCGFADRASFYDYEKKPKFTHTIKRARTFIEKEYEEQLNTGNVAGAIFALKNFGWTDKQEYIHGITEGLADILGMIDGSTKGKLPDKAESEDAG